MTFDDRLRDALRREAATVEPDVERRLDEVVGRTRRPPMRTIGAIAAAATGVIVLAVVVRTWPTDPFAVQAPLASLSPDDARDRLIGTYHAAFAGDASTDPYAMAGDWTFTLEADSGIAVTPPAGSSTGTGETLDGYVYAIAAGDLVTNLLARDLGRDCAASGSYRPRLAAERLILELVEDPCAARVALLTSQPWDRVPAASSSR